MFQGNRKWYKYLEEVRGYKTPWRVRFILYIMRPKGGQFK